jgi:inorganic phosphate transporter, PiT family
MLTFLFVIIALALVFDFINGFHDAANSIATVVSTKVLTPFQAVLWAASFNFIAFWLFSLGVANTVSKTVDSSSITPEVIFAGLIAAIIWNLLTWWFGIPSSSSHTLIGGFAGAAVAHAGWGVVDYPTVLTVVAFIFAAPLVGMIMSYTISAIMLWIFRNGRPHSLDAWFKRLQLMSSAAFSIGHGGNDAQKVMGIIMAALIAYTNMPGDHQKDNPQWLNEFQVGYHVKEKEYKEKKTEFAAYEKLLAESKEKGTPAPAKELKKPKLDITPLMPNWVPIGCYLAIGLGTLMGGWKIVKTMGSKITKVTPFEGVAAESAGAITLFLTTWLKVPVSTTHTITGSIIGVGLTKRISAVRWGVTLNLLWAWILTIPVSALLAAGMYHFVMLFR